MNTPNVVLPCREAVGIFHDAEVFQAAIDDLLSSGFDRADLSLLASERAVQQKLGHRYRRAAAAAGDLDAPRVAYVSTEAIGDAEGVLVGGLLYVGAVIAAGAVVASGGTLAAALAAAALAGGGGGLFGAVLAERVGRHHAHYLQEQLERGGLLLWVATSSSEHERLALEILGRHAADCVHLQVSPACSPADSLISAP
jgi:hypothetical protein